MHDLRRVGEAYALHAPVYCWFTKGLAMKDLSRPRRCWSYPKPLAR
jgi:hypothetical protein